MAEEIKLGHYLTLLGLLPALGADEAMESIAGELRLLNRHFKAKENA